MESEGQLTVSQQVFFYLSQEKAASLLILILVLFLTLSALLIYIKPFSINHLSASLSSSRMLVAQLNALATHLATLFNRIDFKSRQSITTSSLIDPQFESTSCFRCVYVSYFTIQTTTAISHTHNELAGVSFH